MQRKLRLSVGDFITMLIVGAVASVLALVFSMLVRAPESFQSLTAQPQTSLAPLKATAASAGSHGSHPRGSLAIYMRS